MNLCHFFAGQVKGMMLPSLSNKIEKSIAKLTNTGGLLMLPIFLSTKGWERILIGRWLQRLEPTLCLCRQQDKEQLEAHPFLSPFAGVTMCYGLWLWLIRWFRSILLTSSLSILSNNSWTCDPQMEKVDLPESHPNPYQIHHLQNL